MDAPYETSENDIWYKPYMGFENVSLKNGPCVSNVNYGSLFGADSELESIK